MTKTDGKILNKSIVKKQRGRPPKQKIIYIER